MRAAICWPPSSPAEASSRSATSAGCSSRWMVSRASTSYATRSPTSGCRSTGSSSAGTGSRNCSATAGGSLGSRMRRKEQPMSADNVGVIHNIGYRAYEGSRLGRAQIMRALNSQHTRPISYDVYTPQLRISVLIVFIAAQAPDLVSRDLRSHCLPLYFARPIERIDYPVAKLIAFFAALLVMVEVPLLLLYVGTATQLHTGSQIWHETKALIPGLLLGVAW